MSEVDGAEDIALNLNPLLRPRTRIKGILRLGFQEDSEVEIEGKRFVRNRLFAPK